jgi:hypothetical protein
VGSLSDLPFHGKAMTFHGHTGHLWETENGPSDNGLLSLMLGADGFVSVSNTNGIFKVVPQ